MVRLHGGLSLQVNLYNLITQYLSQCIVLSLNQSTWVYKVIKLYGSKILYKIYVYSIYKWRGMYEIEGVVA